jgi:hypothetical protein
MANSDNPRTGADFEDVVGTFFATQNLSLVPRLVVPVGAGVAKKNHTFDLGSERPPVLVECKCHTWTEGGNAPSAKLTVWNEAMLYFACAPPEYRKLLVVQRSVRGSETLAEHYLKRYRHLMPSGVEFWEVDSTTRQGRLLHRS